MDSIGGKVTDNGAVMKLSDVNWATRQLWAPDAVYANGKYYLYFPSRGKDNVFRIGVSVSNKPNGTFKAENNPIEGSYSIDPCVFQDDDGTNYMSFGGIRPGQLQHWNNNVYDINAKLRQSGELALLPRMAKLSKNMKSFSEPVQEVMLLNTDGKPFYEQEKERRFFEGAWMFKREGTYYFLYSTGETHRIVYATGKSPYGPFTYKGIVLEPVKGWTTHVSTINHQGKWYLFYHDAAKSGVDHLRNVKVREFKFDDEGTIILLE